MLNTKNGLLDHKTWTIPAKPTKNPHNLGRGPVTCPLLGVTSLNKCIFSTVCLNIIVRGSALSNTLLCPLLQDNLFWSGVMQSHGPHSWAYWTLRRARNRNRSEMKHLFNTSPFTVLKRNLASALRCSDSYRTVHITCHKCNTLLFKYKKKNGTKSKLIKMYTARIIFDPYEFVHTPSHSQSHSQGEPFSSPTLNTSRLPSTLHSNSKQNLEYHVDCNVTQKKLVCPKCQSEWGRPGSKAGHDIFKCIGGKIRVS